MIQVRMTPTMKEQLRLAAEENEMSIASVIEEALIQYFNKTPSVEDTLKDHEERIVQLEEQSSRKRK